MKLEDYHLHSEYSMDSHERIENLYVKAVSEGIREIAITDHAEMQKPEELPDFETRIEEIKRLNQCFEGSVLVKSGMEIGQAHRYPDESENLINNHYFDFIIGSLHEVERFGSPSCFVFTAETVEEYFAQYFKELAEIAETVDYDVLAHVTYPFRYVPEELYRIYNPVYYAAEFQHIFEIAIHRGKGIEINCSGLRTRLKETMPPLALLEMYKKLGGTIVTVGSDGHSARSAFSGIEEGYDLLRAAGFTQYATFTARNCKLVNL